MLTLPGYFHPPVPKVWLYIPQPIIQVRTNNGRFADQGFLEYWYPKMDGL